MKRTAMILLVLCLLLAGCAQEKKTSETVFAMDTVMELTVWGPEGQKSIDEVREIIEELENTWSSEKEISVISDLNRGQDRLTSAQREFLEQVQALSQRTGGAFDPKLHGLITLWGFTTDEPSVPTQAELEEALALQLWNLGGAVKGYAGDLAVARLKQMDVACALLNLGGNIQTYGTKADGTPWSIGIQNPNGGEHLGVVSVEGAMAVVTSGDYQRYFEEDGIRYHHILDPKTGSPARSGLSSVTVICKSGLTADVLSTALFVMGLEEGAEFWRESDDFEAVFVTSDGKIFATAGVSLSGCQYEVIRREN